jgi:hypothetical protein
VVGTTNLLVDFIAFANESWKNNDTRSLNISTFTNILPLFFTFTYTHTLTPTTHPIYVLCMHRTLSPQSTTLLHPPSPPSPSTLGTAQARCIIQALSLEYLIGHGCSCACLCARRELWHLRDRMRCLWMPRRQPIQVATCYFVLILMARAVGSSLMRLRWIR